MLRELGRGELSRSATAIIAILSSSRVLRGHVASLGALVGRARACAVAVGHGDGRVPQSEARSVVYPRNPHSSMVMGPVTSALLF